jgi:Uma2 family endonuclease
MPKSRLLTADEFMSFGEGCFELIEGELVPMPEPDSAFGRYLADHLCPEPGASSPAHGRLTCHLAIILGSFVLESELGQVYAGRTSYVLERGSMQTVTPNLSFIAADRAPTEDPINLHVPPNLAVEIASPDSMPEAIEQNVATYLTAGVGQVWIVYPEVRQVAVYQPQRGLHVFGDLEEIDCAPELPGLTVAVAEIFDGPGIDVRRPQS